MVRPLSSAAAATMSPVMAKSTTTPAPSSALARLDMFGRFVWPGSRSVRPALEGGVKGHGISAGGASDLSYLGLSVRPGPQPLLLTPTS